MNPTKSRLAARAILGVSLGLGALVTVLPATSGPIASAAPPTAVGYDAIGTSNAPSYISIGFQARSTDELGDGVALASGTSRRLQSATVMMVSWACENGGGLTCETSPGATFDHPITFNVYRRDVSGNPGPLIASVTQVQTIPLRPSASDECGDGRWWDPTSPAETPVCSNGFAAPITFDFPTLPVLPDEIVFGIAYNTQSHGVSPIGSAGPWNSLNVGLAEDAGAFVGTDLAPNDLLQDSTSAGAYCAGNEAPLDVFRVDAPCWSNRRPMVRLNMVPETEATVVVKAATTSWRFGTDHTASIPGAFVDGPDTAPAGAGSARLSVAGPSESRWLGTTALGGTRLDRIARLEYSSYQAVPSTTSPSLQLNIRPTGTILGGSTNLVFEPYYSVAAQSDLVGWNRWSPFAGRWWTSSAAGAPCNINQGGRFCTWDEVLALFPNATIATGSNQIKFKIGSGVAAFTGNVDHLSIGVLDIASQTINTTHYDFEPTAQCSSECYVATSGNDLNGGTSPTDAKRNIQSAVNTVSPTGTVHVAAGTYNEDVLVNKTISLQGAGYGTTTISGPIGGETASVRAAAEGVRLSGFTITRAGNNAANWNNANLNSAGIAVQGQANSVHVSEVRLTGNRTAIDINNSNDNTIVNSILQDNHTGVIFRNQTDNTTMIGNVVAGNRTVGILFLDASDGTNSPAQTAVGSTFASNSISGNWYGGVVERQTGGSLPTPGTSNIKDFSGNWWGTTTPVISTDDSVEPAYADLRPPSAGGTGAPPVTAQPDILGSASANIDFTPHLESGSDADNSTPGFQGSTATLTATARGAQIGSLSRIQEAVNAVDVEGTVHVTAGDYEMSSPVQIDKTIDLLGPNAGVSPNSADDPVLPNTDRVDEATLAPTGGNQLIRVGAKNVRVDGFSFTDPGTPGSSNQTLIGGGGNYGGDASGLEVVNNLFAGLSRIAVYTNGPERITGVTVDDNRADQPARADGCGTGPVADGGCGHQIFNLWKADDVSFSRNVVLSTVANGDRTRVLQVNTSDGAVIADNTIRNACTYSCITLAADTDDVSITGNDVDIDVGNIVHFHGVYTGSSVTIDHNTLTARTGAAVVADGGAAPDHVTIVRNALVAGGVVNETAARVDARCNWWGQSTGPLTAQAVGPVTTTDWLTSDALDGACAEGITTETTEVVDENSTDWQFFQENASGTGQNGRYVEGPGSAPLGEGSAEFVLTTTAQSQSLGAEMLGGTRLADITDLAYSSYQVEAGTSAIALQFSVHFTSDATGWQGRLVYEPTYSVGIVPAGWQRWDALDGNWWTSNIAGSPCDIGGGGTLCTWDEILAVFPDAHINDEDPQVLFRVGTGGTVPFEGNIDHLTVGVRQASGDVSVTHYDFEPLAEVPSPDADPDPDPDRDPDPVASAMPDFNPVKPTRVFDTRPGTPAALREVAKHQVVPGTPLRVKVTSLGSLVPASGVGAVSLNVTATGGASGGYLTITPCGTSTDTSSVNFVAGVSRANQVIAPVPTSGEICITSSTPVHVIADVNGWFTADQGLKPVKPSRVFDTRPGTPAALRTVAKQKVAPGSPLQVQITNLPGLVPASGVGAVSLNVTATNGDEGGYLTVTPCGPAREVSNVNFDGGPTVAVANAVLTPVSATGTVCFSSSTPVDVLVDVNGWFTADSDFHAVNPDRVFDTRPGTPPALRTVAKQKVSPSTPLEVKLTGLPGGVVPSSGVSAVSLTVTATNASQGGYVTVTPCSGGVGQTSSVNFTEVGATANAVLTPVSSTGMVCFTSDVAVDVLVDVNGWFSTV